MSREATLQLVLREAKREDSPALARIQVDSYRSAYAGLLPQDYLDHFSLDEQEQDWRDLLAAGGTDILLVAQTSGGEIFGYALGRPGPVGIEPYDCELVALHVRRERQRQGAGRRLVAALAERLYGQGCTALLLWVLEGNPARGLYEHLGGVLVGRQTIYLGEEGRETSVSEVAYGWPDIRALMPERPG